MCADRGAWSTYAASFLAGLAVYWSWWYAIPVGAKGGVVLPAYWFAMGFVASLGAGRVVQLFGPNVPDAHPSVMGRALGFAGGCGVAGAMPRAWLEVVDFAGLLFIMVLTLGWLVGVAEIAIASTAVLRKRRG